MQSAAMIFFVFTAIAALFQLALAFGAPWGEIAMGGRYPGKWPANMRRVAAVQIVILLFFASVVYVKSGLGLVQFYPAARIAIWFVVAFFVLGSILNLATPSKWERRIWAPVNIVMLATSVFVALNN